MHTAYRSPTADEAQPDTLPPETRALLADYPLPWTAVCERSCTLIRAANGATVLACSPDEAAIISGIIAAMHIVGEPRTFAHELAALASVLGAVDDYPTEADFVDALILCAEAVLAAAGLRIA
jgi:hypothetical protein